MQVPIECGSLGSRAKSGGSIGDAAHRPRARGGAALLIMRGVAAQQRSNATSHKRTNAAAAGGASGSARRRNPPQDVPENAVLQLKRFGAVVLIVSRGHHDNEIELRDDANRLPASTKCANPPDLTPIEQGATEPPQVSIRLIVRGLKLRCRRGLDPFPGNDLAVVLTTASEDELAEFCHIARPQAQSPTGIGVSLAPFPLNGGNA